MDRPGDGELFQNNNRRIAYPGDVSTERGYRMTDEINEQQTNGPEDSEPMRKLREQVKKLEEQVKELSPRAQKGSLIEAGVDLSNPYAELFASSYQGDWTADAIKEAASKYPGLLAEGAQAETQEAAGEQAAHERIFNAATGAAVPDAEKPAWLNASSPEEFFAQYNGQLA